MAETATPRLMAAAKEFNIGKDTLVDFLTGKGFSKDDLKPTSKLTEDMYRALQQEFQSDKVAKLKSDLIDLPKGVASDLKKKKDEEEIIFKKEKEDKKPVKKEEPKEEPAPVAEQPVVVPEPEVVKQEIPELERPKVVDKIDLSAIDSSTRPKKETKKKEEAKEEKKPAKKKGKKEEKEEPVAPVQEAPVVEERAEDPLKMIQDPSMMKSANANASQLKRKK
jgi:translation initiation factor IF-2